MLLLRRARRASQPDSLWFWNGPILWSNRCFRSSDPQISRSPDPSLPSYTRQPMKAEEILSLPELETLAQATMSAMTYGYVTGAAADELTLRANVEDWQKLRLKPTIL